MADLVLYAQNKPVPLRAIAERQGISESYLEQVFALLRKAGLVNAIRGSYGGYILADQPTKLPSAKCYKLWRAADSRQLCPRRNHNRMRQDGYLFDDVFCRNSRQNG